MDEKEKAAAGNLYNANDPQLVAERVAAKRLCREYNLLPPDRLSDGLDGLRRLFGRLGANCWLEQPFYCDYGYNIEIGDFFYANHNLVILDPAPVRLGNHVFIGPNCGLYTAGHPLDAEARNSGAEYALAIDIGDNVWLGGNVVVLPGVTIGAGAVIGAGSVVAKDIPPSVLAVGNPCRVVREIGADEKPPRRR